MTGGEASPASETAHDPTEIAPAVPFGIHCFTAADLREAPTEHKQACEPEAATSEEEAGGHPFAFSTDLTFNFTTNFEGKLLGVGGGPSEGGVGPKEVAVKLPPGLVGNPQAGPQCALGGFLLGTCSESAAVGYIHFNYTEGAISKEGKPTFELPRRA